MAQIRMMAQIRINDKPLNVNFFNETAQYDRNEPYKTCSVVLGDEYSTKTLDELVSLVGDDIENVNISYTHNGTVFNLVGYKLINIIKQFDADSLFVSMEFQKKQK